MSFTHSLVAVTAIAGAGTTASAVEFIQDFSPGATSNDVRLSSDVGQVRSRVAGSSFTTPNGKIVPAITGDSLFTTIDVSGVASTETGTFGVVVQGNGPAGSVGGVLTSTEVTDYDIIFDLAANGFVINEAAVFVGFFAADGSRPLNQVSIDRGLTDLIAGSASNDSFRVSIPLEDFNGNIGDFANGIGSVDRLQVILRSKSTLANYSSGAENVLVFDNAGISVVPEPASAVLLGLGGTLLLARRRNRG